MTTQEHDLLGLLAGRDVACPSCGYNLRGLLAATCPECGRDLNVELLTQPQPLHLERGFKVGFLADCLVTLIMAAAMTPGGGEGFEVLIGVGVAAGLLFTLTGVCLAVPLLRVGRHPVEKVSRELTLSMWAAVALKFTCAGTSVLQGL